MYSVPGNDWTRADDLNKDLELIEEIASDNDMIASEQELSDLFDSDIAPIVLESCDVDDVIAMNEAFINWTDSLCQDGVIHPVQSDQYCYIGKYSE